MMTHIGQIYFRFEISSQSHFFIHSVVKASLITYCWQFPVVDSFRMESRFVFLMIFIGYLLIAKYSPYSIVFFDHRWSYFLMDRKEHTLCNPA